MNRQIEIGLLDLNTGQVPGLPTNPRSWTRDELELLKRSIQETPELLEARGLIVYPFEGRYVILGGNMRYSAMKALKYKSAPCFVLEEDTDIDVLRQIVIKDNSQFGEWDMTMLNREWNDLPLADWGVEMQLVEMAKEKQERDENPLQTLSITFASEDYYRIVEMLRDYDEDISVGLKKALGL